MQKQTTTCVCLLFLCLAGLAPSQAQTAAKTKPPVYTYVAQWEVPRAQWADMVKADDADRPILDKLVADLNAKKKELANVEMAIKQRERQVSSSSTPSCIV